MSGRIGLVARDWQSCTIYLQPDMSHEARLADALQTLLDAVEGNRVTVGDCNQARAALERR